MRNIKLSYLPYLLTYLLSSLSLGRENAGLWAQASNPSLVIGSVVVIYGGNSVDDGDILVG